MFKTILIDDERPAINYLKILLTKFDNIEVIGAFTRPSEAITFIEKEKVDVAFVDIQMPEMDGITLSEKIMEINSTINIIFSTAYNEYAVEAFKLNVLDYILKPVDIERLKITIDRLTNKKDKNRAEEILENKELINIKCFKKFEIYKENNIINFRTTKAYELMAYFISNRDIFVTKDKILFDLWYDLEWEKASVYFHANLYHVRKILKEFGGQNKIEKFKDSYKMVLDNVVVDIYEFLDFIKFNNVVKQENIEGFKHIINLYRGRYMEENDFTWSVNLEQMSSNLYIDASIKMIDYYIENKSEDDGKKLCENILDIEPFCEEIHERILKIYFKQGNMNALKKHYKDLCLLLQEELGVEPNGKIKAFGKDKVKLI